MDIPRFAARFPRLTRGAASSALACAFVLSASPAAAGLEPNCPDPGSPDPGEVEVCVKVLEAKSYHEIDNDYPFFPNRNDLYYKVSINGGDWYESNSIGGHDHAVFSRPGTSAFVSRSIPGGLCPIRIQLWDVDDPDPNDQVDIDPGGGDRTYDLQLDMCSLMLFGEGLPAAGIRAQDGVWLPDGDEFFEHGSVKVRVWMCSGLPVPPADYPEDVSVTYVDLVQIVSDAGVAIVNRPAVLAVGVANTFNQIVNTSVRCRIDDGIGGLVENDFAITLGPCETDTVWFFTGAPDPVVVGPGSEVHYGAEIDPIGVLYPTPPPPCIELNNGGPDLGFKRIERTRSIAARFVRFRHSVTADHTDEVGFDEAISDAEARDEVARVAAWMERLIPMPLPVDATLDPLDFDFAHYSETFGPRSEMAEMSIGQGLAGSDRVVLLVDPEWIDRHHYDLIPSGTSGVSNGKVDPIVSISEIEDEASLTPVHELGHTFGLSDEPCDFTVWAWECEDEYNDNVFRGSDWPFRGSGYSIVDNAPIENLVCFMDGTDSQQWISGQDFVAFVDALQYGGDPRVLVVAGQVRTDGTGQLDVAHGLAEGIPIRTGADNPVFLLVLRADDGEILGAYSVIPAPRDANDDGIMDGDDDHNNVPDDFPLPEGTYNQERADFCTVIPWPARAVSVTLVGPDGNPVAPPIEPAAPPPPGRARVARGGAPSATLTLNESPIAIDLVEPVGTVLLEPGSSLTVCWQTPFPPPHGVAVFSSYDGGRSWWPRAYGVSGDSYVLDLSNLAQPTPAQFRVVSLQDGMSGSSSPPTPARLLEFHAAPLETGGVELVWQVGDEEDLSRYVIERRDATGVRSRISEVAVGQLSGPDRRYRVVDRDVQVGRSASYDLLGVSDGGIEFPLGQAEVTVPDARLALVASSANPTNGMMSFRAGVPVALEGRSFAIDIYGVAGRHVASVARGVASAGVRDVYWDGRGAGGTELAAGVYVVRLRVGEAVAVTRIVRH